jgi:hypothetical protein
MDEIGALLQYSPKSLKRLAQGAGATKGTVRAALKLLELRPYKTTVAHFRSQSSFPYNCTFSEFTTVDLSDEAWFSLNRHLSTQNNRYCWPCRGSAVRRWLPTAAARVRVRAACGFSGGQSCTGAGFLRVLRFPLPIIPPISPLL